MDRADETREYDDFLYPTPSNSLCGCGFVYCRSIECRKPEVYEVPGNTIYIPYRYYVPEPDGGPVLIALVAFIILGCIIGSAVTYILMRSA